MRRRPIKPKPTTAEENSHADAGTGTVLGEIVNSNVAR